jgi:hypothetical protein
VNTPAADRDDGDVRQREVDEPTVAQHQAVAAGDRRRAARSRGTLPPAEAEPLADALAEAATGRTLISA